MPSWCGVVGCSNNNSAGKRVRFYKLPAVLYHLDIRTRDLSIERRARWPASINRKDLAPTQVHKTKSTLLVCSDNFIKG